jgi:putative heme-binding domain-containing protein
VLLDAIERQTIGPSALGASHRRRLVEHRTAAIRGRAGALLTGLDRRVGLEGHARVQRAVLARPGVAARGARPFATHCAACHTFIREGGRVGPDLSGIRNQPADAILLHVLAPDYEITPGYEAYTVQTRDGRSLFGRLESETPTSLTLRDATGQAYTILRDGVVSVMAADGSLMPAGFDQAMSTEELADLLAYLKSARR